MINDNNTTIEALKETVKKFVEDREWQQFHNPKSLSMALASEAAEVMDLFLWCDNEASYEELEKKREDVEDEIVDVTKLVLAFCVRHNIDLSSAMKRKLAKDVLKYPIEKCKGKSVKYTEL
jgi:NTP pyrophosphatase (non-canonical NTP hydrolase)